MGELTAWERAAADRAAAAPMLDWVLDWAAIGSGTGDLCGLARLAGRLQAAFGRLPGVLVPVAGAPVSSVAPDGSAVAVDHGHHLHLTVRPHASVQLLLTGHMDTVYGPDHPFRELCWREPGVLNGPGVADMKGGLAIMLAALEAFETSPLADRVGYELVINADEETGSLSSTPLIARAARGKQAALTYEPALPDGALAGARGGSGNFSLVVTGRGAHAGRNPEQGRNAVVAAADLALRLAARATPGLGVNPARIDGGAPNNVVPDRAVLRLNLRPRTAADQAEADAALAAAVAEVAAAHEVAIVPHGGFYRPPRSLDPSLAALVERAGADLGVPIAFRDSGGVCDGNNIAAAGVPVIDTMGARGGAIHSADEFLVTDSLAERARLSALTLLRLAERGLACTS